jgi:recombination protein RecA
VAAFVDAEHALDVNYARKLGVRTDDLLISQPDTGEQALEIADMLVRSGGIDLLVIDSVAALVPRAEIEGEMGDAHMGLQARLMSQALRKLTGTINRSKTLVVFINQIRMKIGVMFGNPETTTGGNALKFYSSVRLDIRRIAAIKEGEQTVGNRTRVTVVKNKMAPPFREVEFDIMYGMGISAEGDLLDLASNLNVIEKSGTWYTYKDERIGQGRDNSKTYLKEHPEMMAQVRKETLAKSGVAFGGAAPATASANGAAAQPAAPNGTKPATPQAAPQAASKPQASAPAPQAAAKGAPAPAAAKSGAAKR